MDENREIINEIFLAGAQDIPEALREIISRVNSISNTLGVLPEAIQNIGVKVKAFSDSLGLDDNQDEETNIANVTKKLKNLSTPEVESLIAEFDAMYHIVDKVSIQLAQENITANDRLETKLDDLPDEVKGNYYFIDID